MVSISSELEQLAHLLGVETSYEDVLKVRRSASEAALLAALRALGADVTTLADVTTALHLEQRRRAELGIEPVIVVWEGNATAFELMLPLANMQAELAFSLQMETGETQDWVLSSSELQSALDTEEAVPAGFCRVTTQTPAGLAHGYHRLTIRANADVYETCILSAPTAAYDESTTMTWGCFLPLYALRTERNWGAGDFTDLASLSGWVRALGGRLVGTLPILAAFLDEPLEPSPYSPASRLFWNEFYIDIERVPEMEQCSLARELVASAAFQQALTELRTAEEVDYPRIMALKRQVLELLANDLFSRGSQRLEELTSFTQQHPHLRDYAVFRATYQQRRKPWPSWPAELHEGIDYDKAVAAYHCYVQWVANEQLNRLAEEATAAGDGLYLDLPLGVRPDSFDVWRNPQAYVASASAGAPPDAVFTKGQDWGFPPLHPEGIRRDGYRHVREYLAHHMRLARTLRIDHVMGLHRLYWIPQGRPASDGVYVRYRADELYAVLSIESHRHQTTIIGENLGTVPKEVNRSMELHGIRKMFVVQYELNPDDAAPLATVPPDCIASLNTHDMPPFTAWWQGLDIPVRQQLGLMNAEEAQRERDKLQQTKVNLIAWLQMGGWLSTEWQVGNTPVAAMIQYLAASSAEALLVNLEDLWAELRPQNVPGTGAELPNWKRKASLPFSDFSRRPDVVETLQAVARLRREAESNASLHAHETT